MSVVVVAAPMVTRWNPKHSRLDSDSSDNVSNQRTTRPYSASIQRAIDARPILSNFSNPPTTEFPGGETLSSVGQADTSRENPLLITHDRPTQGSAWTRTQTQPPVGHSYSEALPTTSFLLHTTPSVVEAHGDSNEEDEASSDYEDIESDDTEGRNEKLGQRGEQQIIERRKSKRFRLTHNQTRFLMGEFARQTHPDNAQRKRLSKEIPGLSPRQVQVWFQNRRAKLKRLTADDREKMMRSRALPENFDMSRTLRSPFETDAPQGYPIQRQTPLSSPGIYGASQPKDNALRRSPTGVPNLRRVSGDGTAMSPMGFPPYLGHFGSPNIAGGGTLSAPTQRRSLTYDTYQQERSRADEIDIRSTSFSSEIPAHAPRAQTSLSNLQTPTSDKRESRSTVRRSYRINLDMTAHDQAGITSTANLGDTFSSRDQQSNTFSNLNQDALSYLNTQNPMQPSGSAEPRYNFRPNLDPSSNFIPSPHHPFSHLNTLQINTQLQANETAGLLNQQHTLEYGGNIQNVGTTHNRYNQSPATAYQTPISGTTQEFCLPNTTDFFSLPYQSETSREVDSYAINMAKASSDLAESNIVPHQEYYRSEHNTMSGEGLHTQMPGGGSVYNPQPRYQLSQMQARNIMPLAISQQTERFQEQQQQQQQQPQLQNLGVMPPTPRSAGLKREFVDDDGSDEGEAAAQASISRKKRKSIPAPSGGYKYPDPSKKPPI